MNRAGETFDSILETIGHTPVVRIKKLAPAHVNLYVKIEAFNPNGIRQGSSRTRRHRGRRA